MSKKDLGLVGVYPWTDLSELYTFPASSFYDYVGGYKVVNGVCWVDVTKFNESGYKRKIINKQCC